MTEENSWKKGLVAFAGVVLGACASDVSDSDSEPLQPPGGMGGATGAGGFSAGGAQPGGSFAGMPGAGGDTMPGNMPPPPGTGAGGSPVLGSGGFSPVPPGAGGAPVIVGSGGSSGAPTVEPPPTGMPDAGPIDISSCPQPPAETKAEAVEAWTIINEIRVAGGAGCLNTVSELLTSAQSHCDYLATNRSNPSCRTDAHSEINGCPGFTGTNVQAREIAAGYPRQLAYTEVAFTYGNNPQAAIPGWLATPYHRIPLVDPWTTDMGYGGAVGCDVIDFGRGMTRPPDNTISMFPYAGQKDVPLTFNGLESPQPPAPTGGWPSGYPVSIYAQRISVTEHVITKDGDTTPLPHVWLDARSPGVPGFSSYFTNTAILYGAPYEANTTYRVKIVGTYAAGALNAEWTFTTGARRPGWF